MQVFLNNDIIDNRGGLVHEIMTEVGPSRFVLRVIVSNGDCMLLCMLTF